MSIHRSLVVSSALKRQRNVLNRAERIELLEKQGRWTEGDSVFKLPKVAVAFKHKKSKGKKKKDEEK